MIQLIKLLLVVFNMITFHPAYWLIKDFKDDLPLKKIIKAEKDNKKGSKDFIIEQNNNSITLVVITNSSPIKNTNTTTKGEIPAENTTSTKVNPTTTTFEGDITSEMTIEDRETTIETSIDTRIDETTETTETFETSTTSNEENITSDEPTESSQSSEEVTVESTISLPPEGSTIPKEKDPIIPEAGYAVIEYERVPIPFKVETFEDPNLPFGSSKAIQEGQDGILQVVKKVYYDSAGTRQYEVIIDNSVVIKAPINEKRAVGTMPTLAPNN